MTDEIKHIWELLLLMGKLADDDRFKVEYYRNHREERANMCDVLDKIINKGITEGERKNALKNALTMLKDGLEIEKTSLYSGLSIDEVIALEKQIIVNDCV